ncbi:MAG: ester cyclase [Acidobacteriota bacterium]
MTREHIHTLFDQRHDALRRRDSTALADLHAQMGVLESPSAGGTVTGRAAIERVYQAWFTAFPDLDFVSDELLVDGDRVVEVGTISGTDTGGFMGLPPTDKPFRLPMIVLFTVKDGHILHERRVYDFTGLLVQIGVLKAKPA